MNNYHSDLNRYIKKFSDFNSKNNDFYIVKFQCIYSLYLLVSKDNFTWLKYKEKIQNLESIYEFDISLLKPHFDKIYIENKQYPELLIAQHLILDLSFYYPYFDYQTLFTLEKKFIQQKLRFRKHEKKRAYRKLSLRPVYRINKIFYFNIEK